MAMIAPVRWLLDQLRAPHNPRNSEQMAAMYLYSTERRKVRAVPTRRPANRKDSQA